MLMIKIRKATPAQLSVCVCVCVCVLETFSK